MYQPDHKAHPLTRSRSYWIIMPLESTARWVHGYPKRLHALPCSGAPTCLDPVQSICLLLVHAEYRPAK